MALNSENLTYWYFRLNGFFTIPNFVVHPDQGADQRTEVDVFGIRLPHRAELLVNPMIDDPLFTAVGNKIFVAIVEVKTDLIRFNDTWTDPAKQNVQRFLRAAGAFEPAKVNAVAAAIYATGVYASDAQYHVSLVGIGRRRNRGVFQSVPQITWDHIADFIYVRFVNYEGPKASHAQWDAAGEELWDMRVNAADQAEFRKSIMAVSQLVV